jgi:hypothetical protein
MKHFVLSCAGSLLLALASDTYAADTPAAEGTVNPTPEVAANPPADAVATPAPEAAVSPPAEAASNPQPQVAAEQPADTGMTSAPAGQKAPTEKTAMGTSMAPPVVSDPGKVYLIRESPFYWLHIEKSIEHARDAEIAGNMGQLLELRTHAQISLMQAQEAQRAGNVAGLNEGIANLKKALEPQGSTSAASSVAQGGVDPQCIDELERQCGDVQPGGGRIQQCFDDKINNFSSMCQEKLKEGKSAIATSILATRHEKVQSGTSREEGAARSATDFVREARKNLSQAAGKKYVEIKPQPVVAVSAER